MFPKRLAHRTHTTGAQDVRLGPPEAVRVTGSAWGRRGWIWCVMSYRGTQIITFRS